MNMHKCIKSSQLADQANYIGITAIITSFFAPYKVLVGRPVYKTLSSKIVVQIPYYMPKNMNAVLTDSNMNTLGLAIAQLLMQCVVAKTTGGLDVRFIRLRYPYMDSQILAQYLAVNSGKYNFT